MILMHSSTQRSLQCRDIHDRFPSRTPSCLTLAGLYSAQCNSGHSMAPFLYSVSLLHCMPVGLQGGGCGLGMMWGRERARAMCLEAGFKSVEEEEMEFDSFNLNYLCRK